MPENSRKRVLMLVQNNRSAQDTRVRSEAEALLGAGYAVSVISPAAGNQRWRDSANSVNIHRFPRPFAPKENGGFWLPASRVGPGVVAFGGAPAVRLRAVLGEPDGERRQIPIQLQKKEGH
jgi:hypothetical protein